MAKLEIFQNGTSMHPDTMGDPVYQIGSKNADGEYDVVVFDAMSQKDAKARLAELRPVKVVPKKAPEPEKKEPEPKAAPKKVATKKKAAPKKKATAKKKTAKKKR